MKIQHNATTKHNAPSFLGMVSKPKLVVKENGYQKQAEKKGKQQSGLGHQDTKTSRLLQLCKFHLVFTVIVTCPAFTLRLISLMTIFRHYRLQTVV